MSNEIIMDDYDDKDIEINKIKSTSEKILNDKLKDNSNKTELKNNVIIKKTFLSSKEKLIGFEKCYMFEKRAIQFGTKLAHETNKKKYGSNRKANGKAQFK